MVYSDSIKNVTTFIFPPIGIEPISEVASEFKLEQNYPNPFNPVTKIKFSIKGLSVVQTFLSVYDVLGRKVETLVYEQLKPGTYEVEWDASVFASGIYFYSLSSSYGTISRKMILLK